MSGDNPATYVKAIYPFKGSNNDELIFKQGDIITITQKEQDGWCEGTLNGKTGWFPSNYVKEYRLEPCEIDGIAAVVGGSGVTNKSKEYRNEVLKDMIESETNHVQELSSSFKTYLQPLKNSSSLEEFSYQRMVGNYEQVLTVHTQLLRKLEESLGFVGKDQRVGGMFMQLAPHFKKIHLAYCSNHPKAIVTMNENKEAITKCLESCAAGLAPSSCLITVTTSLSKPFRRLEKYQGLLQELERHTDESHVDRGDCQRAVQVYKDIAIACTEKRRRKEMEIDIITPGRIRDWEGEEVGTLGDIVHVAHAFVVSSTRDSTLGGDQPSIGSSNDQQNRDRYFVLFPSVVLMLSVSHRISAFVYEGKMALANVSVRKLDTSDGKYGFEIGENGMEKVVSTCHCREDRDVFVDLLKGRKNSQESSDKSVVRNNSQRLNQQKSPMSSAAEQPVFNNDAKPPMYQPIVPPHRSPTPPLQTVSLHDPQLVNNNNNKLRMSNVRLQQQQQQQQHLQQQHLRNGHNLINNKEMNKKKNVWTMSCLRPSPPLRPSFNIVVESNKKHSSKKKAVEERSYEDDTKILKVIESYCTSAKTRNTINSALLDSPQVLIAEEEKLIVEGTKGNQTTMEERSLVDTVYALKDQVKQLFNQTSQLTTSIETERKCRMRLETFVKKHPLLAKEDLCWDD